MTKVALYYYAGIALMLFTTATVEAQEVRVYAGLGAGAYSVKYSEEGPSGALSVKKSALPSGIIKVGFDYSYWGAELRAGAMPGASAQFPVGTKGSARPFGVSVQASPFVSYLAKMQYPVSKSFNIYALLGGTAATYSVNPTGTGVTFNSKVTKTGFTYGFGAAYRPRPLFAVEMEWIQYWSDVTLALSTAGRSKASFGGFGLSFSRSFDY
ncbi:porin family protein [Mariprofundus erugo]|uniref:Porin family protein n=1 Tax=Mariprofundus erugo TaxID=2528639 RepID=A0A5R9GLJ5_9PROT|nr:outer membrane beta-barrel protein [Mariprofundus erugo]TLS67311.1 porin family protein [Mariprofundus erugo]